MKAINLSKIGMGEVRPYFSKLLLSIALSLAIFSSSFAQIDVTVEVLSRPGSSVVQAAPNPITDYVEIQHEENIELSEMAIQDVSGQKIATLDMSSSSFFVVKLLPGVYFFLIETSEGLKTERVVVL